MLRSDLRAKLANLTNKTSNSDLDHYIRESGHILGITAQLNSSDSRSILNHVLKSIIKFKKNDQ